jgi:FkbM family methyltransferase
MQWKRDRPLRVLLKFRHGLGDAAQSTSLLKNLKHYHPEWSIDVAALLGKHSCFHGQAARVYILDRDPIDQSAYDQVHELHWYEPTDSYAQHAASKVEKCLVDVFGLQPLPELAGYTIHTSEMVRDRAREYLAGVCGDRLPVHGRFPAVAIHYEGNTGGYSKNLGHDDMRWICDRLRELGLVPIILDWETPLRSPLPDGREIFNPSVTDPIWGNTGTGDAEMLAALIEQCCLMIGVDSGPLHVAASTSTPTIGIWTRHHPLHYLWPAENVVNMVPPDHVEWILGDKSVGLRYFTERYQFRTWQSFRVDCKSLIDDLLSAPARNLVRQGGFWIRRDNVAADQVIVQDVYADDCYRVAAIPLPREVVIDAGAHIGAFALRMRSRNPFSKIVCVECCPENMEAIRKNVGSFAEVVPAALTYEPPENLAMLNAVWPGCVSTGGSIIVSRDEASSYASGGMERDRTVRPDGSKREYWADTRPIETITLEQIAKRFGFDTIDVLKLDIEGSEFSVLDNTNMLDRIRMVVGEWHGRDRFMELVSRRFTGWQFEILRDGHFGLFRLTNRGA